jgi:SAM-dependent methyltransferase
MSCRFCKTPLKNVFVDLGTAPPSNAFIKQSELTAPEKVYPLRVMICTSCWLVQTEDFADADELFNPEYAYFSSYSTSWLAHAERYVETMIDRYGLTGESLIVEVAANDGYLLQYALKNKIPCLGIEPTACTAAAAREKGIRIVEEFFGVALADKLVAQGMQADLTAANNVLAHVPDINDFVSGFARLLKDDGVSTFEFPHLLQLVKYRQFDTIYHEHFSYLSVTAIHKVFEANGLALFDIEELPTHGGSLRLHAQRLDSGKRPIEPSVDAMLQREADLGMNQLDYYTHFQPEADKVRDDLVAFLKQAEGDGKKVGAYGAAAKGNTLLNYAGITTALLPYIVDRNPAKQNMYTPGNRIPIVDEAHLKQDRPDYILILPWNLSEEISNQLSYAREWGAQFVTAVPELKIG